MKNLLFLLLILPTFAFAYPGRHMSNNVNNVTVQIADSLTNLLMADVVQGYDVLKKKSINYLDAKVSDDITTVKNDDTLPKVDSEGNALIDIDISDGAIKDLSNNYQTTLSTAERILEKTWNAVSPVGAEAWDMIVNLQRAKGLIMTLPFVIMIFIMYRMIIKRPKLDKDMGISDALWIMSIVTVVIIAINTFSTFTMGLMYLLAPQWYALKEVMSLVIN